MEAEVRRLLINDQLTCIQGTRTFWHDLQDWFDMEFFGGDYATLSRKATDYVRGIEEGNGEQIPMVIRNASYFDVVSCKAPTVSLLQDIFPEGSPLRTLQSDVISGSEVTVCNSEFTAQACGVEGKNSRIIPLPVDFGQFEVGNSMGLQMELGLPDEAVCWIGASQGAAAEVKGFDLFQRIVRSNPDVPFVGVFKDKEPYQAPNLRTFCRVDHDKLVRIIGACKVGLCTSRVETQHLAGIEMGACGLPLVTTNVGTYWGRDDMPGKVLHDPEDIWMATEAFTEHMRDALANPVDPQEVRSYWKSEFHRPVIEAQWRELIEEVERGS